MSYFQRGMNAEPAMVLSALFGLGSLALPLVVPGLRSIDAKETFQYDGGDSHPVRDYCVTVACLVGRGAARRGDRSAAWRSVVGGWRKLDVTCRWGAHWVCAAADVASLYFFRVLFAFGCVVVPRAGSTPAVARVPGAHLGCSVDVDVVDSAVSVACPFPKHCYSGHVYHSILSQWS